MENTKYERITVNLNNLKLDVDNKRLLSDVETEDEIIQYMLDNEDLLSLTNKICSDETIHNTNVIVIKDETEQDSYIVKEGNRRITACKLLSNRSLIPNEYKSKIDEASEDCLNNISTFIVDLYSDMEVLDKALYRLHNEGVREWGPAGKGRAYYDEYRKGMSANQIKDKYGDIKSSVKTSILQFSLYSEIIKELKENNVEYNVKYLSYLPMVDRLPRRLFNNDINIEDDYSIFVNRIHDDTEIGYKPLQGTESVYLKILLAIGKEFVGQKNSISHEKFNTRNRYIHSIDEYDAQNASGFGELKSLIKEYNLLAKNIKQKENLNNSKNSPENAPKNDISENNTANTEPTKPIVTTGESNAKDPNKIESNNTNKAILKLKYENIQRSTFDDPIDLEKFIEYAKDENGNDINLNNIKISSSDIAITNNCIPLITIETVVHVIYECTLNNGILLSKKLDIEFVNSKTTPVRGNNQRNYIATFSNAKPYTITQCGNLCDMVNQLNEMYNDIKSYNKYKHLFACSLRVLFDIPTQILWQESSNITNNSATKLINNLDKNNLINSSKNLLTNFRKILTTNMNTQGCPYDQTDYTFCINIIDNFGISISTFKNRYDVNELEKCIKLTNSNVHNGPVNLTDDDIIKIGHYASFYIFLIDQILLNGKS